ncbi:RNA 2'-phosphotransferase [Cyanobacterium aponinum UTEX 3221]|uniref:RNA 2'-phosphotransferase n=1 Tax=Cyanobacterium aponinum TaxID=379064 RepID=UPI002B4BDD51|nr:RNA 2'-phosphotransferase [Cyanobacterium aponinum]WRL37451.1 RNA 2'-phosphotransferase [Cyanobacterium aponinum UTEX 3221]
MKKEHIKKSKILSLILRHQPEYIDIKLDEKGWVSINELLSGCEKKGIKISREEIEEIVKTNDKKRFTICKYTDKIKANQGHSINVSLNLKCANPPDILYHGTTIKFKDSIIKQGLLKMNRHHVHLSSDIETAKKVGSRHGKVMILVIDTKKMTEDGYKFYLSENNIWLVDQVPSIYFSKIIKVS